MKPLLMAVTASVFLMAAQTGVHANEIFRDDFDGEVLDEHWEVLNPKPDTYIVEDGKLLVVFQDEATLAAGDIPNMFRLNADLPKGDWH